MLDWLCRSRLRQFRAYVATSWDCRVYPPRGSMCSIWWTPMGPGSLSFGQVSGSWSGSCGSMATEMCARTSSSCSVRSHPSSGRWVAYMLGFYVLILLEEYTCIKYCLQNMFYKGWFIYKGQLLCLWKILGTFYLSKIIYEGKCLCELLPRPL